MEDAKCILCGHDAQRKVYSSKYTDDVERVNEAPDHCYDCPECGSYCLDNYEHSFVEYRANDKQKEILSEYVKSHPDPKGQFMVLRWPKIKEILRLQ